MAKSDYSTKSSMSTYPGKRLFDLLASTLLLIVVVLPMSLVALAIWLTMGNPVIFRQIRPGLFQKPFKLNKFRTMTNTRGADGELLPDGARLTKLGSFLRKTSLDEFPELLNVLKGDMSLVGPRPLLIRYLPYFRVREQKRFNALPGITGLAQVNGRNFIDWDRRLELDVQYVESMSFFNDLKILFQTVKVLIFREGVSENVDLVETNLDEERVCDNSKLEFERINKAINTKEIIVLERVYNSTNINNGI